MLAIRQVWRPAARANVGEVWSRGSGRAWTHDLVLLTVGLLLGALLLAGELSEPVRHGSLGSRLAIEAATGLLFCAVFVLLRRRRPAGLALLLIATGFVSSAGIGLTAVALLNVALHRPWRITVAVVAVNAVVITAVFASVTVTTEDLVISCVVVLLVDCVLTVTGMLMRSQRQLVGSLQERARQAEEEQRLRVEEARLVERERLAREMHDVLAHRISLLAVHAGALEYRQEVSAAELTKAAAVIRQNAFEAMEDLREVIGVLRAPPGDEAGQNTERPQPSLTDLTDLIEQSRAAGTDVVLDLSITDASAVPPRVGRHVYRIVQEGLTNARRHASGAPVRVTVEGSPAAGLTVEVWNGAATATVVARADHRPAAPPGAGAGLIGLRERVDLLGGRLEHGAEPDGGFRLRASLPWPP